MTFHTILLITPPLMAGWAIQEHRRRHQFGPTVLTLLVSLVALVFTIRS